MTLAEELRSRNFSEQDKALSLKASLMLWVLQVSMGNG